LKISKVEAFLLSSPFEKPLLLPFYGGERTILKRDAMFIRVTADNGLKGYAPGPAHERAANEIRGVIAPFLEGRDPGQWRSFDFRADLEMTKTYRAVEVAVLDLVAKFEGAPLSEIVGGRKRDRIKLYGSAGMYMSPEAYAEEAAAIFELIAEGGLCGVSIGFNPIEWVNIENSWGRRYIAWDLLEWSVVGVPCNPYCEIVRSYLSSPKQHALKQTIRKALEPLAAPLKAWASAGLPGESEDPVSKKKSKPGKKTVPFGSAALKRMQAAAKKAAPPAGGPPAPSVQEVLQQAKDTAAAIQKALPPKAGDEEPGNDDGATVNSETDDDEEPPGGKGDEAPDLGNLMGDLVRLIAQLQEMVNPPPAPAPPAPPNDTPPEPDDTGAAPPVDATADDGTDTGEEEEEDDEEETEEVLDRYRSGKPRRKALPDDARGICRDASEFLTEHADQENLTKTQRAACRLHAAAMGAMLEAMGGDEEEPAGDEAPPDEGKALDLDAIGAALKDLNGKLATSEGRLDEAVYSITGQKVS